MARAKRIPLPVMHTLFCDAGAEVLLGDGIDGSTPSAVAAHTGIDASRVRRVYGNRAELAAAIYRRGHSRAADICGRYPRPGGPAVTAVIDFVFDLVERAFTDPCLRALPLLESTEFAASTHLDSIYQVWRHQVVELLSTHPAHIPSRRVTTREHHQHVDDVADVVVDALAGFSALHRAQIDLPARLHHAYLLLSGVLTTWCPDAGEAERLRRYAEQIWLARTSRTTSGPPNTG